MIMLNIEAARLNENITIIIHFSKIDNDNNDNKQGNDEIIIMIIRMVKLAMMMIMIMINIPGNLIKCLN